MSRIGKKPIIIPENVEVKIDEQKVTVKGSKGTLSYQFRPEIKIEMKEGKILLSPRRRMIKKTQALWGLSRALLDNMLKGVTVGFEKRLQLEGVGYRARVEKDDLVLEVGFSHLVVIKKPEGINLSTEKNIIIISGLDKEKVGQTAANIRKVRPPEPYKGKGIRYVGEFVRRKEGKRAVATK